MWFVTGREFSRWAALLVVTGQIVSWFPLALGSPRQGSGD